MSEIYNQEIHLNQTDLIGRGWTTTAISRYLSRPIVEHRRGQKGSYSVHLWAQAIVETVEATEEVKDYILKIMNRRKSVLLPQMIPLLDATREASRSAHRWRDRASTSWDRGDRRRAGSCRSKKEYFYLLKDRGIIALHKAGMLRYAGMSPQGMAVYEYGKGGLQCLHSTLHPKGVERMPVEGHPEVLKVVAKKQLLKMKDVEHTLMALPTDTSDYVRSAPPKYRRENGVGARMHPSNVRHWCDVEDEAA
jgi:hypothetical protein